MSAITISLGHEPPTGLSGPGTRQDKHPAGLTFHEGSWSRGNLKTVTFSHGSHNFTVNNVLSVMGTEDRDRPAEGIYRWSINFGVSAEQADTYEAARDKAMEILASLRAAGWERYLHPDDPRLTGEQAWRYDTSLVGALYSLDSTYAPTLDEWRTLVKKRPRWVFQADGAYLQFVADEWAVGRFPGKSVFLFSIEIETEYAFYGINFAGGDRQKINQWKTHVPSELPKYRALRAEAEAALVTQGYTIDTSYQDPPIKALLLQPSSE